MIQKAFRLTEAQVKRLKSYAVEHDMTESDVIRQAIDNLGRVTCESTTENTAVESELRSQIARLEKQLDDSAKKEEKYLEALLSSIKSIGASQALQAAEKSERALGYTQGHKNPFRRLLDRFSRD